jgi:hypothetical protein
MTSHLIEPKFKCQRFNLTLIYYSLGLGVMLTKGYFRIMSAMTLENLGQIIIMMAKVRRTNVSFIS